MKSSEPRCDKFIWTKKHYHQLWSTSTWYMQLRMHQTFLLLKIFIQMNMNIKKAIFYCLINVLCFTRNTKMATGGLTSIFTVTESFDCCVEKLWRNHVFSVFISNMKLTCSSFHQMQHFHETMNVTLFSWDNSILPKRINVLILQIESCLEKMRTKTIRRLLTLAAGSSTKLLFRICCNVSSGTLVVVWHVSCTIFNVWSNSFNVT